MAEVYINSLEMVSPTGIDVVIFPYFLVKEVTLSS